MGEVVPARTSPILHPPSPPTVHQLLRLVLEELISVINITVSVMRRSEDIAKMQGDFLFTAHRL